MSDEVGQKASPRMVYFWRLHRDGSDAGGGEYHVLIALPRPHVISGWNSQVGAYRRCVGFQGFGWSIEEAKQMAQAAKEVYKD